MSLFGKKQKTGDVKTSAKKAKKKLYKTPQDAKLFYIMPVIFVFAVVTMSSALFLAHENTSTYQARVMASSMPKGTKLPSWGQRQTNANLKVGNSIVTKDGKDMAIQITYDSNAHSVLTSFGNQYKLRLITPNSNPMKDVKISYGMFGTDGSGVLELHSDKGFEDKAFVVMLVDGSQLVTSDTFSGSGGSVTDADLDNSITAQLSNNQKTSGINAVSSSGATTKSVALPPIYYIRINPYNATKIPKNWRNDRELVDELFINDRIKQARSDMNTAQKKLDIVNKSIDEMNRRLQDNPEDTIAKTNHDSLVQNASDLSNQVNSAKQTLQTLSDSKIKNNVLQPKQTKHDTIYTNIDQLK